MNKCNVSHFYEGIKKLQRRKPPIPTQIESVLGKEKVSVKIKTYEELKAFLA